MEIEIAADGIVSLADDAFEQMLDKDQSMDDFARMDAQRAEFMSGVSASIMDSAPDHFAQNETAVTLPAVELGGTTSFSAVLTDEYKFTADLQSELGTSLADTMERADKAAREQFGDAAVAA